MSVRREARRDPATDAEKTYYRVDINLELPDGRTIRVRKADADWSKREAEEWERQKRNELLNPSSVAKIAAPVVSDFFDEWITTDCVARGNRKSTIREKKRDGVLYIKPQLGTLRLDEVNFRLLTAFVASLAGKGLAPKSQRNISATLRRMMVYAAKLGVIAGVPEFPSIKVPRTTKIDWFTRGEVETLLAPVMDERERATLLVGFDCGLRSGEQIALTWGSVTLATSSAYPHGSLTISRASSRGEVTLTKSGEVRHVPLTARCAAALRAIRGLRHLEPTALVFPDPSSQAGKPSPLSVGQLNYILARACARAALRRLHRHGARHSYASNMVALGVPLLQVSRWLGHSDVSITARVYAHLSPTDGAKWLDAYEAPVASAPSATAAGS